LYDEFLGRLERGDESEGNICYQEKIRVENEIDWRKDIPVT
jgi:hypothetical protein